MEEEKLKNSESELSNSNKNVIIAILSIIIVALIGIGVYFAFIKKDESGGTTNSQNGSQINNQNNDKEIIKDEIEFKQVKSSYIGDIYLDTNGRTYFVLSQDETSKGFSIIQSFIEYYNKTSKKYTNIVKNSVYNNDSIEALDLGIDDIDEIDYVTVVPENMDCYTFLANGGRLYLLNPVTMSSEGKIEIMKPNVLQHDIDSVATDSKGAYVINNYDKKIYLSDAIYNNISRIEITDKNQKIKINGKTINVKIIGKNDGLNGELYVNDKVIHTFDYDHVDIFVMDKFLLIVWPGGQCLGDVKLGAINENGEYIDIDTDNGYVNIYDIHMENNKVLAKAEISTEYELCGKEIEVELSYDGKKLNMKKA